MVDDTEHMYGLLKVASDVLPDYRVSECSKWRYISGGESRVTVCGSIWVCPVCTDRIIDERREELSEIAEAAERNGWSIIPVVLALDGCANSPLSELLEALIDAWRRTKTGAPWLRFKDQHGLQGDVNALEITYGRNGWHAHKRVILLVDHDPDQSELQAMQAYLERRFRMMSAKSTGFIHGLCDVYIPKRLSSISEIVEWELAYTNPDRLLSRCEGGSARDAELYNEYAGATKGRRRIWTSRGLRGILGLNDCDAEEEEPL